MTTRETSAEIEEAATMWLARLDRAPLGGDEQKALQAWLDGDIRRLGAFARAQATMQRLETARALGPHYEPDAFLTNGRDAAAVRIDVTQRRFSRRAMIGSGGAALAFCSLGAGGLLMRPIGLDYASDGAGSRRVALEDGSVLHLNTASAIEVRFTAEARTVLLKMGEVLFDVAQDAERPFIVLVGKTSLRALDTVFSVRRQMGAAVRVMVRSGVLELSRATDEGPPLQLRQNMLAQVDEDQGVPLRVGSIDPVMVDNSLSWLEGNLTFRGAQLGDAADEFARYNGDAVLMVDPSLRAHRISGAFAANDPQGFARAVAMSYGLRVKQDGRAIRILPGR